MIYLPAQWVRITFATPSCVRCTYWTFTIREMARFDKQRSWDGSIWQTAFVRSLDLTNSIREIARFDKQRSWDGSIWQKRFVRWMDLVSQMLSLQECPLYRCHRLCLSAQRNFVCILCWENQWRTRTDPVQSTEADTARLRLREAVRWQIKISADQRTFPAAKFAVSNRVGEDNVSRTHWNHGFVQDHGWRLYVETTPVEILYVAESTFNARSPSVGAIHHELRRDWWL